jgi:hypothetical protein
MKYEKILQVLVLTGLTVFNNLLQAQVTVGCSDEPLTGAALDVRTKKIKPVMNFPDDLENSDKGILFPKVKLIKYDSLAPLYTGVVSAPEKLKATGMIVYNVAPVEGIEVGLAQWNGSEWVQVAMSEVMAKVECAASAADPVKLNGNYTKNVAVDPTTCTLIVPVDVKKMGIYNIRAIVFEGNSTTEAAFSFSGSGEFAETGVNYAILTGQGMPVASTAANGNQKNRIELYINGKQLSCATPLIYVNEKEAIFSYDCGTTRVFCPNGRASIQKGVAIDPNNVKIMMRINSSSPGAEYHIETDTVNGVWFSCDGILNNGSNTVILEGHGTPVKSGAYNYTISGNNSNHTVMCSAMLNVEYDQIKVLLLSDTGTGSNTWDIGCSSVDPANSSNTPNCPAAIPMMLKCDSLFDFGNCPTAPFHIKDKSSVSWVRAGSASNYNTFDKLKDYHLVVISYNINVSNVNGMVEALCEYVKSGKTCLFTTDRGGIPNRQGAMNRIINILSNNSNSASPGYDHTSGDDGSIKLLGGNLAVNGKYMDLTGLHIGRDGGGNFLFRNLPDDWVVLASNDATNPRDNAKLIMHKRYRMFLSGDGGIFSGGSTNNWDHSNGRASRVNASSGMPVTAPTSRDRTELAYNAHFLANLLIWAFEAATN